MNHDEIEDRAARYVMRRDEPEWSPADQAGLDAWLAESTAHKAAYWRLSHGWAAAGRLAALGAQRSPGAFRRRWSSPSALAAGLSAMTIALMAVYTMWRPGQTPPVVAQATYATPIGGRRDVELSDGSRTELNTATHMRSAVSRQSREVWLDEGEAFFKVAHDPQHPFVVHAGRHRVTVLGTSFSVRRQGDELAVSVLEGRVRVDRDQLEGAAELRAPILTGGQMAVIRGSEILVSSKSPERVERTLAWRDGMLSFDGASLADVAADFNRYGERKIVVTDPRAASIRVTGTFRATNSAAFLRLLEQAYGLKVSINGEEVKISE